MVSSAPLRHQASRSLLRHQVSSLALKHQVSRRMLRHKVWLTMHVRNLEDLTELIFPFDRSTWLSLSIPSSTVSSFERSANLVFPFHLTLWQKENFSLLVLDKAYFGLDGVIRYELYVCPGWPKGLEFGNDTWTEAPSQCPLICLYPVA